MQNERILLARRPQGLPVESDFRCESSDVPELAPGQVLVKAQYLSVDPYMRGRMSDAKSYVAPYALNEVITGGVVGEVIASKGEKYSAGDIVQGELGWQRYSVVDENRLSRVPDTGLPASTALGVLGMTGLTAYCGLMLIGKPKPGETVLVSGAAGAVGSIVGQIAKIKGCRVVGIAGSDEKVAYLKNELGFDEALNYKTEQSLRHAIRETCPAGVDVYFDNVGGEVTDAAVANLNDFARMPLCGQIAGYNATKLEVGPRFLPQILVKRALVQGFIVSDYRDYFREAIQAMAGYIQAGQLTYAENVVDGFENTVDAFLGLFRGDNLGKQLVKI